MGHTFVHFKSHHIDALDGALEIWLLLLVGVMEQPSEQGAVPEWARSARNDWHESAVGGFGFGIVPDLDTFIITEERRQAVLRWCAVARRDLGELGDPITAALLNRIASDDSGSQYQRDLPASVIFDAADSFITLIRDTPL